MRLVGPEPAEDVGSALRDLPRYLTASTVAAGAIAALLGMTGPWLLAYQAALNAGYSTEAIGSWLFAIFVGGGALSLVLAIVYRQPICGAYPIAGSALLIPILARYTPNEAVGAYLLSGGLMILFGATGLFGWLIDRVPNEVILGMLAGVLLRFGTRIFEALPGQPAIVGGMVIVYLLMLRFRPRVPAVLAALAVGAAIAGAGGRIDAGSIVFALARPVFVLPSFSVEAFFSLSLPLTLLALASQNAPGIGILAAQGYRPPVRAITIGSGLGSILTAPLLGHGINIAAPMTAICADPEAHPDPRGRYVATVVDGVAFVAFGLIGATAVALVRAFPAAIVTVTAGLAILPVILQSIRLSIGQPRHTLAAGFALLIAASDLTLIGISGTFWAVIAGVAVAHLLGDDRR